MNAVVTWCGGCRVCESLSGMCFPIFPILSPDVKLAMLIAIGRNPSY